MDKMHDYPSVSLVMTTYNLERFVAEALRSVLAQKYDGKMELIIVDDASKDDTPRIIKEILLQEGWAWKVCFIQKNVNGGVAAAVDTGVENASNEWIVLVDGDDIQAPDRVANTAKLAVQHPEAVMIHMSADLIDSTGLCFGRRSYANGEYDTVPEVLYLDTPGKRAGNYLDRGPLHICSYGCAMALKKSLYDKWGGLCAESGSARFAQDPPWELRAFLSGPVIGSKAIACQYRTHDSNILNRTWGDGAKGIKDMELFHASYQNFVAATQRRMLQDVGRAASEDLGHVTDWSKEDLGKLRSRIAREIAIADMRSNWWTISIFRRVARAFASWGKLPPHMKYWPWWRLMPLWLFARVKARKLG